MFQTLADGSHCTQQAVLWFRTSPRCCAATVTSHTDENAKELYPDIADPVCSGSDFEHRTFLGSTVLDSDGTRNPHRLSFNDVDSSATSPLLRGLFNEGFAVYKQTLPGVVGDLAVEATAGYNIKIDSFGIRTGTMNERYIVAEHVPVSVAWVRVRSTGANVAFKLDQGVIRLGTDLIAGTFSTYAVLVPNQAHAMNSVVATRVKESLLPLRPHAGSGS